MSTNNVVQHYADNYHFQLTRLELFSPVEYAITLRKLDHWVPNGCIVADIGCGPGHYALHLARRGCQIHLIDIAANLLEVAQEKFYLAKLQHQILSNSTATATNLDYLPTASVDAVLLFGPLYHLTTENERKKALQEAWRILKPGGIIFAAGINRLSVLRDLWDSDRFSLIKTQALAIKSIKQDIIEFMQNGVSKSSFCPQLSEAYFATCTEFRHELLGYFNQLEFLGVESFAGHQQHIYANNEDSSKEDWLDLLELSSSSLEGMAASEHFLFIGQKGT